MSNVYQKLLKARTELQTTKVKASGKNTFANYTYLELDDFMPEVNRICAEIGLCGCVSFGAEEATLTIINIDKQDEKVVFASPMSTAELKGCHPVQNLGAVQSYLRRYLWIAALEIVEHDALDATHGKDESKKKDSTPPKQNPPQQAKQKDPPTQDQLAKISELCMAISDRDLITFDDVLRELSEFEGKNGPVWLTAANLNERCTKGWAGKVIAAGEAKLKD